MNVTHKVFALFFVFIALPLVAGCSGAGTTSATESTADVYPRFTDNDGDGVNDHYRSATHDPGSVASLVSGSASGGHSFLDENGDDICDYAQNSSDTWHGPGFVDEDGNGVCDYWQEGSASYDTHGGMSYIDTNANNINDYHEEEWHNNDNHAFVDVDGNGICDMAAEGGVEVWHGGPHYTDSDGNGVSDAWQPGGMGYHGMDTGDMGMGGSMM